MLHVAAVKQSAVAYPQPELQKNMWPHIRNTILPTTKLINKQAFPLSGDLIILFC